MRILVMLCLAAAALAGCAAQEAATKKPATTEARTTAAINEAALSPFSDLNLVRVEIPPVLVEAKREPYARLASSTCEAIGAEVLALDAALGPDLDAPADAANPSLVARGSDLASDSAASALKGAAEGVIPYRSWVRKLSGAERLSRQVAAAIAGGTMRRSYLKGLGEAKGCDAPAAPLR